MIRRPPRSTLFPYNDALPISEHDLAQEDVRQHHDGNRSDHRRRVSDADPAGDAGHDPDRPQWSDRSEEHTSELQSHLNLVCRLLLEKKKSTRREHHSDTEQVE